MSKTELATYGCLSLSLYVNYMLHNNCALMLANKLGAYGWLFLIKSTPIEQRLNILKSWQAMRKWQHIKAYLSQSTFGCTNQSVNLERLQYSPFSASMTRNDKCNHLICKTIFTAIGEQQTAVIAINLIMHFRPSVCNDRAKTGKYSALW